MTELTFRTLCVSLREGKYTSVGSYPKYYVCSDGGVLSHRAVLENIWQIGRSMRELRGRSHHKGAGELRQWRIIGIEVNYEDPELFCDDTNERIPSAYAEEEVHECSG